MAGTRRQYASHRNAARAAVHDDAIAGELGIAEQTVQF